MNNHKFKPKTCKFENPSHCRKCGMHKVCSIYLSWNEEETEA